MIEGYSSKLEPENSKPSTVDLNITAWVGGNNFSDTFAKAYNLMSRYVSGSKIRYVFMTDVGCAYVSLQPK